MKNCGIELVTMKSKIKLLITGCMGRMGKQLIKTSKKIIKKKIFLIILKPPLTFTVNHN